MKYDTGMTVTIYEDPFTKQKPEGQAVLRELYRTLALEMIWRVEFVDEPGEHYERSIVFEDGDEILCEATCE